MDTFRLLLSAVCVLLTFLIHYKIRCHLKYWKDRGIPYESPHLLYGNFVGYQKTKHYVEVFEHYFLKFKGIGPFCGFFMLMKPAVLITNIKLAKRILITDFANFTNRGLYFNEADDPFSANLIVLENEEWRSLRQKVTPAFTAAKMKFIFPTSLKVGHELNAVMRRKLSTTSVLDMEDFINRYTIDTIASCGFGIDCNSLTNPETKFYKMVLKAVAQLQHTGVALAFQMSFQNLARRIGMRWNRKDIEDYFMGVVRETVTYREKNNVKRNDFMNLLIEIKSRPVDGITFEQLATQAFQFFIAGYRNSAAATTWAIYELARNPTIQERLREEVNTVFERNQGDLTYESMHEMKYLEQVISETMRIYSIIPIIMRRSERNYQVPDHPNYTIEEGMTVFISHTGFHMDPDVYPDPKKFDPDRFAPEMLKTRDPFSHLPFAAGPRQCIGLRFAQMQICIGLSSLIRNFKFSITQETAEPKRFDNMRLVVTPKDGMFLRVEDT